MEEEKVKTVNPKRCYFIVTYPDGRIIKGNALLEDAWKQIPEGLSNLKYELSDGSDVVIPGHIAYSVEVDRDEDTYYTINVLGLEDSAVKVYRINLREIKGSPLKIGNIIIGNLPKPKALDSSWKHRG